MKQRRSDGPTSSRPPVPVPKVSALPLIDKAVLDKLQSPVAEERKDAANQCKGAKDIAPYNNLLDALKDETERDVTVAILEALDSIGEIHNRYGSLSGGFEVLKAFIESHTADHELVEKALSAFRWTAEIKDLLSASRGIRDTPDIPEQTSRVLSRFIRSYDY